MIALGPILIGLLALLAIVALAVLFAFVLVPVFKGVGAFIAHIARFIWGMISDLLRLVGAILLSAFYVPVILGNIIIGRWSASRHFGNALTSELGTAGVCLYRLCIGHLARLFLLQSLTEGFERRLPAVMAAAPTADLPRGGTDSPGGKRGQFEGYTIVGSLASGGSGAKLYVAEPDAVKAAAMQRMGLTPGQVVIKSFSLAEGSSLPQIVRESRSLDAAKRMGLILDHELTPERFYYVMRYVPGESLAIVTRQLHASSPAGGLGDAQLASAIGYAIDLVSTLSAYHRGGLWHKDVKPDNIIVASRTDRKAHLVDFGLVSSLRSAMTLTTHGTEYFRDPELVRRALQGVKVHEVDGTKFDVFAAGAVLYSMVEDSFPAHGVLSQISRRCPEAIKWVIRRAMTEYDKRYVSADAMLADLQYVAMAKDPFAVKPFELPSMRGGFAAANDDVDHGADAAVRAAAAAVAAAGAAVVGGAAASPTFAAAGSPAVPPPIPAAGRRIPRIKVTNWWNGQVEVEGHETVAGYAAAAAPKAVSPNVETAPVPFGAVPPPIPVNHAAGRAMPRPLMDPSLRQSATAQLDAARNRVDAARARVKARFDGRRATQHFQTNPTKGGVALALCVFVGAVIGVGVLVSSEQNDASQVSSVVVEDPSLLSSSSGPAWDEGAVFEDVAAPVPPEAPAAPALIGRTSPVSTVESAAPATQAELVVINDLKQPWSEAHRTQLEQLAGRLAKSGITLLGESPLRGAEATDRDVTIAATLRMALGQSPHDSSDAKTRALKWLEANGGLGGVLWVTPSPSDATAEPILTLIRGQIEDRPWKAVRRALETGRPQ